MTLTLKHTYIQKIRKNNFKKKGSKVIKIKVLKTKILTNGQALYNTFLQTIVLQLIETWAIQYLQLKEIL